MLVTVIRACFWNGIGKNEFTARLGAAERGKASNVKYSPNPNPKKSPIGASTLGVASSSQYIRSTIFFKWYASSDENVNQICVISPGPASSKIVSVSPGAITR